MTSRKPNSKKIILGATVAGLAAVGGFGLATANAAPNVTRTASALVAQTDTDTGTGTDSGNDATDQTVETDHPDRPARTDEQPLTGDIADQVTAAALAAVPGGTIERVESDGDGAVYEAHMTDADGNPVTVTFDADVNVVEIQEGRGPGGPGGHGGRHGGDCQDGPDADSSTDSSTDGSATDGSSATTPDTAAPSTTSDQ